MQAIGEYVVVKPYSEAEKQGMIIIPAAAQESLKSDSEWVRVVSVGDECKNPELKAGREALILLGSCLTIPLDKMRQESLLLCKYSRVVAVRN